MRWWDRVVRWDDEHRPAVDAAVAVLLAVLLVPASIEFVGTGRPGVVLVAGLAMSVAVAFRRTHPAASAATVFAVALAHLLAGALLVVPLDLLVLVSLYSVTVHGPRWAYRTAILSALAGSGVLGVALVLHTRGQGLLAPASFAGVVALMAVTVFAVGLVRRARRTSIGALRDRAERLEVERDQQARIATAAERARIAREMHDIVAHSLSVIIAQADGGRYAAPRDPAAAERALTTVAETGRAALADMRRLLGVLRTDDRPSGPGSGVGPGEPTAAAGGPAVGDPGAPSAGAAAGRAGLRPQPGVDELDQLVAQVRDSGARISLVRMGAARLLPPGTGLAVYRIAQESLTNVLKHAGPDVTVTVLVQWSPTRLVLEVTDDGRGAAAESDGGGQGLLGMRERATMLGGRLVVGPRPGGGYRVRAELPLPRPAHAIEETP